MFALLLFKKIKLKPRYLLLVLFFIVSLLTLQRAAFLGIAISLSLFMLNRFSLLKILVIASVVSFGSVSYYSAFVNSVNNTNESRLFSPKLFIDEIGQFSLSKVQTDRENQAIITNNTNIFHILFGEGFGKYSPNNDLAPFIMPDASYFRIFNELGLIGFFLFFIPFILMLLEAFRFKDYFMIYFIFFSLVAFYFNRVLWAIPINYLFFTSLGIFSNFKRTAING